MYNIFGDPRMAQNQRRAGGRRGNDRQDFFPGFSNSLFFDPFSSQSQETGQGPEESDEDEYGNHPFYSTLQKQPQQLQMQQEREHEARVQMAAAEKERRQQQEEEEAELKRAHHEATMRKHHDALRKQQVLRQQQQMKHQQRTQQQPGTGRKARRQRRRQRQASASAVPSQTQVQAKSKGDQDDDLNHEAVMNTLTNAFDGVCTTPEEKAKRAGRKNLESAKKKLPIHPPAEV
ncbi:hypothetical protein K457DRAFT_1450281 [Linnemannia elongata AG-77]|uniref:Uncharacterized protein n=1 Tax=Linnemannia elongata AG-77 TaxID=1314771 RepID=A0A197JSP2_9FUNG|nr:hypothetical protein K457DRAFT_1450281 [Linnemannia elongata AG-77]